MRVITVDRDELGKLSLQLHSKVKESGYGYDTLVAVASAGLNIASCFPDNRFFVVKCHRGADALKKKRMKKILGRLPQSISSLLRIMESKADALKEMFASHLVNDTNYREVSIDDILKTRLMNEKHRVLVVDDASDSGKTLMSVKNAVLSLSPQSEVRTAVITQTRKHAIFHPDYYIFNNNTLIRFPWAPDFKQR